MTRKQALDLIKEYQDWANAEEMPSPDHSTLRTIRDRFPDDGSENKAMRWLGFCQGVLLATGVFTLDELKDHSRRASDASTSLPE